MHVHDLVPFPTKDFDFSHTIHQLTFGEGYPGMKNPLDGITISQQGPRNPTGRPGMFQYFLRVRRAPCFCRLVFPQWRPVHAAASVPCQICNAANAAGCGRHPSASVECQPARLSLTASLFWPAGRANDLHEHPEPDRQHEPVQRQRVF